MTAAQERVEDDELVVDPAQWPNPEHQQLERIAAYKKGGNSHSSYWKNTEEGHLALYHWLNEGEIGTPFYFKKKPSNTSVKVTDANAEMVSLSS